MGSVADIEPRGIIYHPTKHLVGQCFEYSEDNFFDDIFLSNPTLDGYFIVWFNKQDEIEEFEFSNDRMKNNAKKEFELFSSKHGAIHVQQLLKLLKEELTKKPLITQKKGINGKNTVLGLSTSWDNIEIEVDQTYKVKKFIINGIKTVSLKGVFDWEEIFFEQVKKQLRLRHLFKEKEAL